jgi:ribonuclease D
LDCRRPNLQTQNNTLLTTTDELSDVVERARAAGIIGIDTEFMRERTYRARLCLVQISVGDDVFLIDPLSGVDLGPVAQLIADASVEKILHAGRQDLELFFEAFAITPQRIFDVQIAAGFAGYGASLPYGVLVRSVLGKSVEKGEAYSDWCRRPLTGAQLKYAADDVRFLIPAAQELQARLVELGRLEWAGEEMAALESTDTFEMDPAAAWRRVSGKGGLSSRQLGVLKELAHWREKTAARRDLPRGWVVKDATLVEIARRQPKSVNQMGSIRGLNRKEAERSGPEIIGAIERGRGVEPAPEPQAPPRQVLVRARMMSGIADAVVRARCEQAGIATELVSTRSELESLLANVLSGTNESDLEERHRLVRGWRRELAGDAVLALARGETAVRISKEAPYVEEVPL